MRKYDPEAGIVYGPFPDCGCDAHHAHGPKGPEGCPVCNPPDQESEDET